MEDFLPVLPVNAHSSNANYTTYNSDCIHSTWKSVDSDGELQ